MSCLPLTVMRPGSPGPAPTRKTFPSVTPRSLLVQANSISPCLVLDRRDLRGLDLAASAPEHVRVEDRNPGFTEMLVDGRLVVQHDLLGGAVRDRHDVDVG